MTKPIAAIASALIRVTLIVALGAQSAAARELWVDRESRGGACSDSRAASAVTKTTPVCTLGAAANLVMPGDTVRVRGGTYTEAQFCAICDDNAVLQLVKAGTPTSWIRFVAEAGEQVVLQGGGPGVLHGVRAKTAGGITPSFNEVTGFTMRNFSYDCISIMNVPDTRLIRLEATGCGRQAVALHQAQRVTLESSRIHDNVTNGWTSAIDLWQCQDGNFIRVNLICNNRDDTPGEPDSEGHGVIMDRCAPNSSAVIENNVIWNNEGWCITILNANGATIRNNTCYQNGRRNDGSGEVSTVGNTLKIHNNVLVPRSGRLALSIRFERPDFTVDPATVSENYNLLGVSPTAVSVLWGTQTGTLAQYQKGNGRGWGTQSIAADPAFVDAAALDFRITGGSPARDNGDLANAAAIDVDGRTRPQGPAVDRGAYELAADSLPAAPTNLRILVQ